MRIWPAVRRFCCSLVYTICILGALCFERIATIRNSRHRRAISSTARDDAAREFERLYRESYGGVYGWVRVRMPSDADAEDVVSEAYLKAARSFETFDPSRAKFGTWVTTIARNCMVSQFRKQRPAVALEDAPEGVFAQDGHEDEACDLATVKQLLACLEDDERELIALKYHEGMRNVEIANELGINQSTVSTKLARALSKMRKAAGRG